MSIPRFVSFGLSLSLFCTCVTGQEGTTPVGETRAVTTPAGSPGADGIHHANGASVAGDAGKTSYGPVDYNAPSGNSWFERTKADLGTFFAEESAVGRFTFKNPHDATHQLSHLLQSCTCSKSILRIGDRVYELTSEPVPNALWRVTKKDGKEERERVSFATVGPHETGEVEVHMQMAGHSGHKEASLDMQVSDEALPAVKLQWRATGAVYFVVSPPEFHLNEMTWQDKRDFQFEITSPIQKDFEILELAQPLSRAMHVEWHKEMRGDQAVWIVKGTYGPGVEERDSGGIIQLKTDVKNQTVQARVMAMVKGPLEMNRNGFLSIGVIPAGTGKVEEIT